MSTGDILRAEIIKESEIGLKAQGFMNAGKLVPDKILLDIIGDRITQNDCKNGYLLDGFPRTLNQAVGLDEILVNQSAVIALEQMNENITARLWQLGLLPDSKVLVMNNDANQVIIQQNTKQITVPLNLAKRVHVIKE